VWQSDTGDKYMVMEYLPLGSLQTYLRNFVEEKKQSEVKIELLNDL
jgi:hypothetical protein